MVGVAAEGLLDDLEQFIFHLGHCLARRQTDAVGDAEDVCIDGDGFLAEGGVEYHVGGLAADAG